MNKQMIQKCTTAMVAGMLIGFGVIINNTIPNKIVGALFFSFGLLMIIALQLPLYTGRIGFMKTSISDLTCMILANLIGTTILISLYYIANPNFIEIIHDIAIVKFEKTMLQMFISGILCGMLIHFAVKAKEQIITVLAIAIFILIGAEHCIADFPFLISNLTIINIVKWILVIIGNSLGAMLIEWLLTENKNGKFSTSKIRCYIAE